MSHPDEGVLQELLDGELAPADAAVVRAHLAGCPPCTAAFEELRALQVDANDIVARLPLDPPLARATRRTAPRRAPSLRLIGLAASALLVAGTSWILYRSARGPAMSGPDRQDTGAGIVLPMPTEERKEVESATPPAPKEAAKLEAPAKDPAADDARRANAAEPADAPVASPAAPPPAPRLAAGAMQRAANAQGSVAEAESRLGARLRTIDGLTPFSVDILPHPDDSVATVRQHYLVDGVAVVLIQQTPAGPARDEVTSADRRVAADGGPIQPGRERRGPVAGARPAIRSWNAWGSHFVLEGALPADSIDALMKRVK